MLALRSWLWVIPLAVIATAVMMALNPRIGFANGFNCDVWYFFGLYRHYDFFAAASAYQLDRFTMLMPWIFFGEHMDGHSLTLIRFWSYFLVTCIAFAYAAQKLFNPAVAMLTTMLLVLSKLVLGALSTEYVAAPGMAWTAVLVAVTVRAAHAKNVYLWGAICGVVAMCALAVHLPVGFFAFTTPFLFFAAPVNWTRVGLGRFIKFCAAYVGGVLAGLVALGLVGVALGRSFFFLQATLRGGANIYDAQTAMELDWSWATNDSNVFLLLFVAAGALAAIAMALPALLKGDRDSMARLTPALILLPVIAFIYFWESAGLVALRFNAYAPMMYAVVFLALGAVLNSFTAGARLKLPVIVIIAALLAVLLVWAGAQPGLNIDPLWALTLAGVFAASVVLGRFISAAGGAIALGAASAFMVLAYPPEQGSDAWNFGLDWRDTYQRLDAVDDFLADTALDAPPKWWVSSEDYWPMLAPRTFMECAAYPASFPALEPATNNHGRYFRGMGALAERGYLSINDNLVLIGPGENLIATANAALAPLGVELELIREGVVSAPGAEIVSAAATRVVRVGEAPSPTPPPS